MLPPPRNCLVLAFKKPSQASYILGAEYDQEEANRMQTEHEIDALLARSETGSIIDRLLALPYLTSRAQGANEWDRAVSSRFEANLARQMRSMIDGGDDRRNAA